MYALRVRRDLGDVDDRGHICVPRTEVLGVVTTEDSCGLVTQCDDDFTCKLAWWFILTIVLLVVLITALAMCCIKKACC